MIDLKLFLFIFLICSSKQDEIEKRVETSSENAKLIFAQVIFRHGDRNIAQTYPTDPWKNESHWPGGFGQLTDIGIQQGYELGKYFRERYDSLLGDGSCSEKLVYVRSTDFDRTLMSAEAVLAGMFPPRGDQIWNEDLLWQPIPVHTVPRDLDHLFFSKKPCPLFYRLLEDHLETQKTVEHYAKYKQLFQYLEDHSGMPITDVTQAGLLYDTLWIEELKNKTLPEWTRSVFYPGSDFEKVAVNYTKRKSWIPEIARLGIGFLLREILNHCSQKLKGRLVPDRTLWLYSAHDSTIAAILNSFGRTELHNPSYGSSLHFELYKSTESHFLLVSLRNSSVETTIKFPVCGNRCSIEDIRRIYQKILPADEKMFDEECRLPFHIQQNSYIIIMICASGLPIVLFGAYLIFSRHRIGKNAGGDSFYRNGRFLETDAC